MNTEKLLHIFHEALDIATDSSDGNECFFVGTVSVREPAGLDAMLSAYTKHIDDLLATLPLTPVQYLELVSARAFTYDEYKALWLPNLKPKDYHHYIIFRVLLITDEQDRLLFTSNRDTTHESFETFLQVYTAHSNPFLYNLLYEMYD